MAKSLVSRNDSFLYLTLVSSFLGGKKRKFNDEINIHAAYFSQSSIIRYSNTLYQKPKLESCNSIFHKYKQSKDQHLKTNGTLHPPVGSGSAWLFLVSHRALVCARRPTQLPIQLPTSHCLHCLTA